MNEEHYESFLESETQRMNSSARTTWIIGGIIIAALIVYFGFILTMVKSFTEPENAAFLVADKVKSDFPSFMESTEEIIASRSDGLAEDVSKAFIDSVPNLRKEAQGQLDLAHTEMIPHVSEEFSQILTTYIRDHEREIRLLADQGDSQEFTDSFVGDIMDEFATHMDEAIADHFDGRDLSYIQDNTLIALKTMETYLDELITKSPAELDRKEALQKQILAALTRRITE